MNRLYYKRFIKRINWNKTLVVGVIAVITTIISVLPVIVGYAKTNPGTTYMWTGHYFLDYFYYLEFIVQGIHGKLIAEQYFATGDTSLYIHLYPYLFIGYIAKLLHITAIQGYWLFICGAVFFSVILMHKIVLRVMDTESFPLQIMALLLSIFAAPFFLLVKNAHSFGVALYNFWYSNGTFFNRFEPIPHHILGYILIMSSILLLSVLFDNLLNNNYKNRKILLCVITLICPLTMLIHPFEMIVFLCAFGLISISTYMRLRMRKTGILKLYPVLFFIVIAIITILAGYLMKSYYAHSTTFSENFSKAEIAFKQNISLLTFVRTLGPVLLFGLFGIKRFFSKINTVKLFLLFFTLVSFAFFFLPFDRLFSTHSARFLSPINYITLGVLCVYGVETIFNSLKKYKKIAKIFAYGLIFFVISTSNIQAFFMVVYDKNIDSSLSFISDSMMNGFLYLEKQPSDSVVLTTPNQFIGQILPIFANKRVYIARNIATPNYDEKSALVNAFFLGAMNTETAYSFLKKNGINYVYLASMDGYVPGPFTNVDFTSIIYPRYSFLREVFKNKDIVIFKVL